MRAAHVIVGGALIIALIFLVLSVGGWGLSSSVRYPIDAPRFEWPVTIMSALYKPAKGMGTDAVTFGGGTDTKAMCATVPDCTGKAPSVPILPNYIPTIG